MKKFLCVVLSALMLMSMCGCAELLESILEEPVEEPAAPQMSVGEVLDNVYVNEFADVIYTAPAGWVFATPEELAELMGVSADLVAGGDANIEELSKLSSVHGMIASNADNTTNIQFVIENLEVSGNERVNADGYLKILALQIENLYTQEGADVTVSEVQTMKIGKYDYSYLELDVKTEEMDNEQIYASRKVGNCIVSIIVSSSVAGDAMAQLECFD